MTMFSTSIEQTVFPFLNKTLGLAEIRTDGECLYVSTGRVQRCWMLCPAGLKTIQFLLNGRDRISSLNDFSADWNLKALSGEARFERLMAKESNDEGFTSRHLQVDVEFVYPDCGGRLIYRVWCYPGAPGIRTQLLVRGTEPLIQRSALPLISVKQGEWDGGALVGIKMIALKLSGLTPGGSYILAVSMNINDDGSEQNLKLQTIDGELHVVCSDQNRISPFAEPPGSRTASFEIPPTVFPDGTCDFFVSQSGSQVFANLTGARLFAGDASDLIAELKPEVAKPAKDCPNVVERISCDTTDAKVAFIGYRADTQNLNSAETELLEETGPVPIAPDGVMNHWASILALADDRGNGLMLVKESHKCVNTTRGGAGTGGFKAEVSVLKVSGAGWSSQQLQEDEWHACWATWSILYQGGQDELSLALKQFDRLRYPVRPERDIYIMANTWGGGRQQQAATEANVLREMQVQAELGIDVQQIDDGWEGPDYVHWTPAPEIWPVGWQRVREEAERLGLKLGLWFASNLRAQDLMRNHQEGGFCYFKLDFGNFETMDQVERMRQILRNFCKLTHHTCCVNWDVTEASPRSGYFWGREFGNVYLENRTQVRPERCVYQPWLVLRDAWQVAKYMNLNQLQLTVQNGERIAIESSDAALHDPTYLFAQTMMGMPLFFQETQFYSEGAKAALKPLVAIYKEHREKIFSGFVFPIGEKPDNASWSGFQCVCPNESGGYILLFRQINNSESSHSVLLLFLKGRNIFLQDLVSHKDRRTVVAEDGSVEFENQTAPGFVFYKYEVEEDA